MDPDREEAGFAREALYRALDSDGNPELATLMSVIAAFVLRLNAHPHNGNRS